MIKAMKVYFTSLKESSSETGSSFFSSLKITISLLPQKMPVFPGCHKFKL
jgi:hypothetical protein